MPYLLKHGKQLEWQNDVISTSMRRKSRRIDVNTTLCAGWDLTCFISIPAGEGRQNNVVLTSLRRDDVRLMVYDVILTSWA